MYPIKKKIIRFLNESYIKNLIVLVSGTAFAQLITIIAIPFLTRLYTPADFSALAVYAAILGIVGSIACLRFEIAIPLPRQDRIAINLTILAILCTVCVALIIAASLLAFHEYFNLWTKQRLSGALWIIPIGVFLLGTYNSLQFWNTRKKEFKLIARTRMVQAVSGVGVQIGGAFFGLGMIGLIAGLAIQSGSGVIGLAAKLLVEQRSLLKRVSLRTLASTCKRYVHFPKYSTLESFCNVAAIQGPILFIASVESLTAAYVMLAMRILGAPLSLIGASAGQVYLSQAAEYHRTASLKLFTKKILIRLCKIGAIPIFIIAIVSPLTAEFFLGKGWSQVGTYILIMSPWFFVQFVCSPISMSLHVSGLQKLALSLSIIGVVVRVGSVVVAHFVFDEYLIGALIISSLLFYLFYLIMIFRSIR